MKHSCLSIWKFWFFFAVLLCLANAFYSLMPKNLVTPFISLLFGTVFALWKILKPNIIIHNLTEIFIYGGLAAILVPIKVVTPNIIIENQGSMRSLFEEYISISSEINIPAPRIINGRIL